MKIQSLNSVVSLLVLAAIACNFGSRGNQRPPTDPTPDEFIFPTEPPEPTPIILEPTSTPIVIIKQPRIYNFLACYEPCLGSGANSSRIFSGGTQKIYLQWHYEAIPEGAHYSRIWTVNGEEWVRYECTWPGPETGVAEVELREPGGLYSGTWEVKVIVNGVVLLQEQLFLDGDWSFWDRAGTFQKCG
jgi:hypothetical protein